MKTHHDHQNSVQENERPENESPEEITVNNRTTYRLRNGRFRRQLSQNRNLIITHPLKKSVIDI